MRRPLAILGITFYLILLGLVTAKLFFEDSFDRALNSLRGQSESGGTVTIGLAEPFATVHPLAADTGSRARLAHIFEPLVTINRQLQLEPRLAISYGRFSETQWEFRIRPGVVFHDGRTMTRADVLFSLSEARSSDFSQLKDYLASIEIIEERGEDAIVITTREPDPLLPQKLSFIPIFSPGFDTLIGTGPYEYVSEDNGVLTLKNFENYWGAKPFFSKIVLMTLLTKESKLTAIKDGSVDILASIPADEASRFEEKGFDLVTRPSLEVNFLLFNNGTSVAALPVRRGITAAINRALLARFGHGFTQAAAQFAPNGVFGFNPTIENAIFDAHAAKQLAGETVALTATFPKGLETPAKTIQKMLANAGITVALEFLASEEIAIRMKSAPADLTFFGWRFDLGDVGDFLQAVAHSKTRAAGQFNVGYRNSEVDALIAESQTALDSRRRLGALRAAMKIITLDDPIGVPLWTPELLYVVRSGIRWQPRIDGYVLAQEAKR